MRIVLTPARLARYFGIFLIIIFLIYYIVGPLANYPGSFWIFTIIVIPTIAIIGMIIYLVEMHKISERT